MSYLVLARKYRPTTFADVIGQEHVVRTLQNAMTLGRVHHAFVFTGARGVGKTTCARVLAKALNCDTGMRPDPCGVCASCKDIASGVHPDVLEIDGASNTGVDNVRELRETVRYLPARSKFKVYVIDEVHMLSTAAFNALLKTLEEPPAHVKFVFATTEPQKIPVTILSRCQRFDFRRVSTQTLAEHLRKILGSEEVKIGAAALASVVREAQGSVRDALSLLDQVLSYAGNTPSDEAVVDALGLVDRQTVFRLFDAITARDANQVLSVIAEVDQKGHELGEVAGLFVDHLRDVLVAKSIAEPTEAQLDRSPGELEQLRDQAKSASAPDLHRMFALAVEVAEDVARSPFAKVSFEMGMLRLLEIEPSERIDALLKRLESGAAAGLGVQSGSSASSAQPLRSAPPVRSAVLVQSAPSPQSSNFTPVTEHDRPAISAFTTGDVNWPTFVEMMRTQRPALASVLEHGKCIVYGAEGLELGYVPKTFYWEKIHDPETRALVEKLLMTAFGKAVPLKVTAVSEQTTPVESIAENSERKRKDRYDEIDKRAREHPAVKAALATFGGDIKEVIVRDAAAKE
ncbi:MAG: DNA polymerase III subunit gamma/tau [Clostridia bacterium]|nr:DNA polymerase III subunit gamma/tau [Deltaproteobacteria bacterium]